MKAISKKLGKLVIAIFAVGQILFFGMDCARRLGTFRNLGILTSSSIDLSAACYTKFSAITSLLCTLIELLILKVSLYGVKAV